MSFFFFSFFFRMLLLVARFQASLYPSKLSDVFLSIYGILFSPFGLCRVRNERDVQIKFPNNFNIIWLKWNVGQFFCYGKINKIKQPNYPNHRILDCQITWKANGKINAVKPFYCTNYNYICVYVFNIFDCLSRLFAEIVICFFFVAVEFCELDQVWDA